MFYRLGLIKKVGGNTALFSTGTVLLGTIFLSIAEPLFFKTYFGGIISFGLTVAGWVFKNS